MSFISVHDTHRLPYFNATITARKVQEGDTTPLPFKNAVDEEDIGYTVYTNARGYLCSHDGTLYTKGVFVDEDAYITATMGDGATHNWVVRSESDVDVNDGKLAGRAWSDADEGRQSVVIAGVRRILLHSANDDQDRVLDYDDIDNTPQLNDWKDVQQVVKITGSATIEVGKMTKTLVIQWGDSTPSSNDPIVVSLQPKNSSVNPRYAQTCTVLNTTPYNLTIADAGSGKHLGTVCAKTKTLDLRLFFTENKTTGNWKVADTSGNWTNTDGFKGSVTFDLNGTATNDTFTCEVSDRTPNVFTIQATSTCRVTASPKPSCIKVNLTAAYPKLTLSRVIRVVFVNASSDSVTKALPLKLMCGDREIAVIYSGRYTEILLRALTSEHSQYDASYYPNELTSCDRPGGNNVTFENIESGTYTVPDKCDSIRITSSAANPTVRLNFNNYDNKVVRVSVTHSGTGHLTLQLSQASQDSDYKTLRGTGTFAFAVIACSGMVSVCDDKLELKPDDYSYEGDGVWTADITKFRNKVDLEKMGFVTGQQYGSYTSSADHPKNDLVFLIPLSDSDSGRFEIVLHNYASHTRGSARVLRMYAKTTSGTSISIGSLIDTVDSIFVNGGRYIFEKSGSSITRVG